MQDTLSICYTQEKPDKVLISKIWACSEMKILTVAAPAALLYPEHWPALCSCSLAASWALVSDFETEEIGRAHV